MQASNTLRSMKFSSPCRKLMSNVSRPPSGKATDAMRKRNPQLMFDKMKKIDGKLETE